MWTLSLCVVSSIPLCEYMFGRSTHNRQRLTRYPTFSAACRLCVASGYIQCPFHSKISSNDSSRRWWQRNEDGSMHDRRSDEDYLELLELPADSLLLRAGFSVGNLTWNEWRDRLQQMTAECKGISRLFIRHGHQQKLVRIHKYM